MKLIKESLLDNDIILEYELRQLQQKRQKEIEDLLNDKRTKPNKTFDTPQDVDAQNDINKDNDNIVTNTKDNINEPINKPKSSFLSKGYDFMKGLFDDDENTKIDDNKSQSNISKKPSVDTHKRKKQDITNEDVKKFITYEAYKRFLKKYPDAKPNIIKSFFTVSPYEYQNTKDLNAEKYESLINNRVNAFEKKYVIEKNKKEKQKEQNNITNINQNNQDDYLNISNDKEKPEPIEAKKISNNVDTGEIKYANNIDNNIGSNNENDVEYKNAAEDKSFYNTNHSYYTHNAENDDEEEKDRKFTYQYDTPVNNSTNNTIKKDKNKEKLVYNKKIKSYLSELKSFVDEKDPFKIKDAINLYKRINKEQTINTTSKNKSIAKNAVKEVYTNIAKKLLNKLINDGLQLIVNSINSSEKLDKDEYDNLMGLLNVYNNNYTYKILPDNKNTLTKAKNLRKQLIQNTDINNVLEHLSFYMLSDKLENIYETLIFDINNIKEVYDIKINEELNNNSVYTVSKQLLNESINIQSDTNLNKIAKTMGVSLSMLTDELKLGMEIEKKYTDNKSTAFKMAMKNIQNKPTYYTEIKRIQNLIKKHKK